MGGWHPLPLLYARGLNFVLRDNDMRMNVTASIRQNYFTLHNSNGQYRTIENMYNYR